MCKFDWVHYAYKQPVELERQHDVANCQTGASRQATKAHVMSYIYASRHVVADAVRNVLATVILGLLEVSVVTA